MTNEVIADRVNQDILAAGKRPGGPSFSLFTGDVADGTDNQAWPTTTGQSLNRDFKHRRWTELIADPLADGGVPIFGRDRPERPDPGRGLSHRHRQLLPNPGCQGTGDAGAPGPNLQWRQTMAAMAPWEQKKPDGTYADLSSSSGLTFKRISNGPTSVAVPDVTVPGQSQTVQGPTVQGTTVPDQTVSVDKQTVKAPAPTHYAEDVYRGDDQSSPHSRSRHLAEVPNSLRRSRSPPRSRRPAAWLDQMLCIKGSLADTGRHLHKSQRPKSNRPLKHPHLHLRPNQPNRDPNRRSGL